MSLISWWNELSFAGQIFGAIAFVSTVILLLQTILLLLGFGIDGDDDFSIDNDPDMSAEQEVGMKPFTIRGFIAFFSLFGWCGFACIENGVNGLLSVVLAVVAGLIGMFGIAAAFVGFAKLQEDGTTKIEDAIGKTGTVYLTVPPNRSGAGKVNVVVAGTLREFDAYTDSNAALKTGTTVEVVGAENAQIFVKPLNSAQNTAKC